MVELYCNKYYFFMIIYSQIVFHDFNLTNEGEHRWMT